jgi:hypothetical protein
MIASKLATLQDGQTKVATPKGVAQPDAAALLNVSPRSVQRARDVQEQGTAARSGRLWYTLLP